VQAQEHAEALWSLGMRVREGTAAGVQAACDRGDIVRTHVMRPTWHFVAAADLRWLLRLTAGRVRAREAGRLRELGLDAGTLSRADETLARTVADGEPRTRAELARALAAAGIDPAGQRIAHIVMNAELGAVICSGPRRGSQHTYVGLDRSGRVPTPPHAAARRTSRSWPSATSRATGPPRCATSPGGRGSRSPTAGLASRPPASDWSARRPTTARAGSRRPAALPRRDRATRCCSAPTTSCSSPTATFAASASTAGRARSCHGARSSSTAGRSAPGPAGRRRGR